MQSIDLDAWYFATMNVLMRLGMNNPPTAVGGILTRCFDDLVRPSMNHPPTAVGGILSLTQFRQWVGFGSSSCERIVERI